MPRARLYRPQRFSGERLRVLRTAKGLEQASFADLVPCTPITIWRLENGHTANPDVDLVVAVAAALDVAVEDLLVPVEAGAA
jgi:transcriptional regulator with XRE-family HTH domain